MASMNFIGFLLCFSCIYLSQGQIIRALKGSSSKSLYASKTVSAYPPCSEVSDLTRYANCPALKHQCKKDENKMKYYCPITCNYCVGVDSKVPSPPVKESDKCKTYKYGCCKDKKTKSRGVNGEACPENCFDKSTKQCDFFKSIGYCDYYENSMVQRCPLTCGFCQPLNKTADKIKAAAKERESGCFDSWRTEMCAKFKRYQYCDQPRFARRMEKQCRKTCGKCAEHAPDLLSIASDCAKNGGTDCCWDKTAPVNGECPICKDTYSTRFCGNFLNDCDQNHSLKSVQIRILCPKSCGMCDTRKCKDDIVYGNYCRSWRAVGECRKHPNIMKVYCPKTCGMC